MAAEHFLLKPKKVRLRDGEEVTLRPEVASDLEPVWDMFSSLSAESLQYLPVRFTRERVEGWFKEINYDRVLPILAFARTGEAVRVVASATLSFGGMEHNRHVATFGVTVHDDYQNRGLGTALTRYMAEIAGTKGLKRVTLEVVADNLRAVKVYECCGFRVEGRLRMNHWNYTRGRFCDDLVMGLVLGG
jgi:RimJ/RimL family protein N-acetyltransferase